MDPLFWSTIPDPDPRGQLITDPPDPHQQHYHKGPQTLVFKKLYHLFYGVWILRNSCLIRFRNPDGVEGHGAREGPQPHMPHAPGGQSQAQDHRGRLYRWVSPLLRYIIPPRGAKLNCIFKILIIVPDPYLRICKIFPDFSYNGLFRLLLHYIYGTVPISLEILLVALYTLPQSRGVIKMAVTPLIAITLVYIWLTVYIWNLAVWNSWNQFHWQTV